VLATKVYFDGDRGGPERSGGDVRSRKHIFAASTPRSPLGTTMSTLQIHRWTRNSIEETMIAPGRGGPFGWRYVAPPACTRIRESTTSRAHSFASMQNHYNLVIGKRKGNDPTLPRPGGRCHPVQPLARDCRRTRAARNGQIGTIAGDDMTTTPTTTCRRRGKSRRRPWCAAAQVAPGLAAQQRP